MNEQLRRLDEGPARLVRQLKDATAELGRVRTGLDADSSQSVDMTPLASTGADERRPRASGAMLRLTSGHDRTARVSRRTDLSTVAAPGSDLVADKRDQLALVRLTSIDGLHDALHATRDELRERVRQLSTDEDHAVVDDPTFGAVAKARTTQLRQAFDAGARAASADPRCPSPAANDDVGHPLAEVLEEVVVSPTQGALSAGLAADDHPWVPTERLDAVISDASEAMVVRIAETQLSCAYERGKLATWLAGDVVARRWIVDPRGHRNDEACRRDAAVGAVAVPEPFPSGEDTPPRHCGCTCTTVAVDEENSI